MMETAGQWGYWAMQIAGGVLALFLLYRGLLRDRSNGRPRCPRCGYDRTGAASPTCPECGHTVRSDKDLYRTRRHWRSVMAAGLVVAGMWYAVQVRHRVVDVKEPVRSALVPTTWKILTLMSIDRPIDEHLSKRFYYHPPGAQRSPSPNHFWTWQEWLLAHLLRRIAMADQVSSERATQWLGSLASRRWAAVDALVDLSASADLRIRQCAVGGLGNAGWAVAKAWPIVRDALEDPTFDIQVSARRAVSRLGHAPFREMSDEELCRILPLLMGEPIIWSRPLPRDLYLHEILRRARSAFIPELEEMIDAHPAKRGSNIELIATLRRLQHHPKPLVIELVEPTSLRCNAGTLPKLTVRLRRHPSEEQFLILQHGGDNRGPRSERWRFEVRDARGAIVQRLKPSSNFGGMSSYRVLDPEKPYTILLDMAAYIEPLPAGDYQVVIAYHNDQHISYARDLSDYIVTESEPIRLSVDSVVGKTP